MGKRVTNSGQQNFGTMQNSHTVLFGRVRRGADDAGPIVKEFPSPITVQAGNALIVNAGDIDIDYPNGDLSDAHIQQCIDGFWKRTGNTIGSTIVSMEVDLMTGTSGSPNTAVPVNDPNYSQVSTAAWTESDI